MLPRCQQLSQKLLPVLSEAIHEIHETIDHFRKASHLNPSQVVLDSMD